MNAKSPEWPNSNSTLLQTVITEFKQRSKAIKYKVSDWKIDVIADGGYERMNFDFIKLGSQVRLSIWEDGALWYRACKGSGQ